MRRYLFDTGIAQAFINRRGRVRERADLARRAGNRIGICTPVLGELWSCVEGSIHRESIPYRSTTSWRAFSLVAF